MVYSNNTQLLRWTLINLVDACDNYSPYVTQRMSFQPSLPADSFVDWMGRDAQATLNITLRR